MPDPGLLFYSRTISEITWFSLGTDLLQVPLQLIKGKKKREKKIIESSIFCSCLLKSCLCRAETPRMPHKEIWFQCHGFLWRTKFSSTSHILTAFTPLLLHCNLLYLPFFSHHFLQPSLCCYVPAAIFPVFICLATDVFSCSFSKSTSAVPVIDFLHYSTCAGDLKDTFVWWSFGEWLVSVRPWTCSRLHNIGEASSCQAADMACTKLCTSFNAESENVCDTVHKGICSVQLIRNTRLENSVPLVTQKTSLKPFFFWYSSISWLMHLSRVSASPICSTYCVLTMNGISILFSLWNQGCNHGPNSQQIRHI